MTCNHLELPSYSQQFFISKPEAAIQKKGNCTMAVSRYDRRNLFSKIQHNSHWE